MGKQNPEETIPASRQEKKKNNTLIYILVLLGIAGGVFLWKQLEINSLKKKAETQRAELEQKVRTEIVNTHQRNMQVLVKPLVWCVRAELMQNNINQVHVYLNEMVKEKNFKNIIVANDLGIIISSTNKKFEGQSFSSVGNQKYLNISEAVVDNFKDSLLVIGSPIMGLDKRVGTLMITYAIPTMQLK